MTLFQVYEHVINPDKLRAVIAEGERRLAARHRRLAIDKREHLMTAQLTTWAWHPEDNGQETWTHWSQDVEDTLTQAQHHVSGVRRADGRMRRTKWPSSRPSNGGSKTTGCASSRSSARPSSKASACSCRCSTTTPRSSTPSARPRPPTIPCTIRTAVTACRLPPLADLIEQGKVVALNFPVAMNPGLARALGTMLKQDFQRAVLNRMSKMQAEPARPVARRRVRVR